jgi:rhodanese-related sulfurtransferase
MCVKAIDPASVKIWLDRREAVLVDVREPREHAHERIEGAVLVPLGGISAKALPDLGGKKLVLHCQGGVRSIAACQRLRGELDGVEIYNLEGGIKAWAWAGLPVQKPERSVQHGSGASLASKLLRLFSGSSAA